MADNQRPDGVDRRIAEDIPVPSEDPAGKENKEKTYDPKGKAVDGKKETKEEEMVSHTIIEAYGFPEGLCRLWHSFHSLTKIFSSRTSWRCLLSD
jgi:hypothetical protein